MRTVRYIHFPFLVSGLDSGGFLVPCSEFDHSNGLLIRMQDRKETRVESFRRKGRDFCVQSMYSKHRTAISSDFPIGPEYPALWIFHHTQTQALCSDGQQTGISDTSDTAAACVSNDLQLEWTRVRFLSLRAEDQNALSLIESKVR